MNIIWVSKQGSDATGDGSYDKPYLTIDEALTHFADGDQIRILDGTYTPTDSVVISGKEGSIFAENPQAVYIQPQKTRSHAAGVAILDSARFLLYGVNVLQAADTSGNLIGIYAENVENFICLTCSVSDFHVPSGTAHGIFAAGSGRIERCRVANFNGAGPVTYGIRTAGVLVIDCEVEALSGMYTTKGIYTDGLAT